MSTGDTRTTTELLEQAGDAARRDNPKGDDHHEPKDPESAALCVLIVEFFETGACTSVIMGAMKRWDELMGAGGRRDMVEGYVLPDLKRAVADVVGYEGTRCPECGGVLTAAAATPGARPHSEARYGHRAECPKRAISL